MKSFHLTLVLLCSIFAAVLSLSCMSCDRANCGPKPKCKGGYTKDVCGCCDVCAKVEGERCGGYWNHFGRCDMDLTCVLRVNGKLFKTRLGRHIQPGHCEDDMCAAHKCGLHQKCSVVNGFPKCECPRHCKNKEKPLCGVEDGKEYLNECHLRRYECKIGQRIRVHRGPCRYCAYKGQIFKFGELIQKKDKCQVCSCAHGRWKCIPDRMCRRPMPIVSGQPMPCVVPGPRARDACPRGQMCAYVNTPKGQSGFCVPKATKQTRTSLPTTTEPPSTPVECPLRKCIPCEHGYKMDSNGCRTCQCLEAATTQATVEECPKLKCKPCKYGFKVDKNGCQSCQCTKVNVCSLPKFTGPCKALFPRYFFNKKTGKCSRFIYGGCRSNGNNFRTRKQCELKCLM